MRIAISGAHCTGKTTLIEGLSDRLPKYRTVEEPYSLLEEEGYEFNHPPTLDDFEQQLVRSLELLSGDEKNILFDRCPIDFLAYALVHPDSDSFDLADWLPEVEKTMKNLDLVVFVPIETRDRIRVPKSKGLDLRIDVDEKLKEIVQDNLFGFETEVLEVSGDEASRVNQVLTFVAKQTSLKSRR